MQPREQVRPESDLIVIIEDDRIIAEGMGKTLQSAGFSVVLANRGLAGLEAIDRNRPMMAIIDVFLPDMTGFELCDRIRSTPALRDTYILLTSGLLPADYIGDPLAGQGPDLAVEKPLPPSELLEIVSRVVKPSAVHR